ncbi:predicted protein [Uncinocarpus reesii 1704]|uniref:Protein kinase domain-containing protein n=1 Tax=Uncinocarpus reesii (strain UAMH 1704) TaxID=336963 RepID=C4JEP6_UNCRE|nr:uncharacterized protein UREG_02206 [Uncinocarpus reesii 1704]EEP77357.1 predicted protein [Uncinocarpus reesii 1704]
MAQVQYPVKRRKWDDYPGWTTSLADGPESEMLREYEEGGLCPIVIDDVLSGDDLFSPQSYSFKIIGKLGWGSYSTVWLGKELQSGRFLALKVLRREHITRDNVEMRILKTLGKLQLAFFYTHQPTQDQFLCLGLLPLGATFPENGEEYLVRLSDLPSITTVIRPLLTKVLNFHKHGICHGDLSHSNIAFGVHPDAFTSEALQETFQEDSKSYIKLVGVPGAPPPRPANLPEYIVFHRNPLKTNSTDLSLVDIIEFGKAFDTPKKDGIAYALNLEHLFGDESIIEQYCGDDNAQVAIIENFIRWNTFLKDSAKHRALACQLIHALLQVDPERRDPEKAMQLLCQLEADTK